MKIEQTYLFKNGKPVYFVSTINRMSSTNPQMEYAETIAFELNDKLEHGNIVDQAESSADSLDGHDRVVKMLRCKL